MIINFDTCDRQLKIVKFCFEKKWDVFFNKLFDYLVNPSYETEAAFLYQLVYEASMQDMSMMYMYDSKNEKEAIKKTSNSSGPKTGFNDLLVLRIRTQYSIYFTKFWEENRKQKEKMFRAYIKDNYELGRIDDYIGEFEKIK